MVYPSARQNVPELTQATDQKDGMEEADQWFLDLLCKRCRFSVA